MLAAAAAVPSTATAARGIELMSTAGNDPADIQLAMPAADGRSALLQSRGSIAGAEADGSGGADDMFWSRRGAAAWSFTLATPNTPLGAATQPLRMTPDGSSFVVATGEQLSAADTDTVMDLYRYDNGVYTLLTGGEPGGDSSQPIDRSVWVSDDLTRIIFSTKSSLLAADQAPAVATPSSGRDVYQWLNGTLSLISVNDAGQTTTAGDAQISGSQGGFLPPGLALFRNIVSADGGTVFFVTNRKLDPGDTDTANDVYARIGNDTVLISDGPSATDPNSAADFAGASAAGTKACFTTPEKIIVPSPSDPSPLGNDTDGQADLYCRTLPAGAATRVSVGAVGTPGNLNNGNGAAVALAVSDDASRVFFITKEQLTPDAPATGTPSIYVNAGGATTLVTPIVAGEDSIPFNTVGKFYGPELLRPWRMTPDGKTAVFVTAAKALPAVDTDSAADVYRWKDGTLELLSNGPAAEIPATLSTGYSGIQESSWAIGSADLSSIVFQTAQPLVAEDTDTFVDVYESTAAGIKLVSTGPSDADVLSAGVSPDGNHVYLHTRAALLPEDDDQGQQDVYVAWSGERFPTGGAGGGSAGPVGFAGGGGALPGLPSLPAPTSVTPAPGADASPAHVGSSGSGSPRTSFEATVAAVKDNSAVRLNLQPPSAGRAEVELTARIGGKRVRIGRVIRAVRAGETPLRVGLSRSARRQLRRAGVLKVSARVRFVPDAGSRATQNLAITLRSHESKR